MVRRKSYVVAVCATMIVVQAGCAGAKMEPAATDAAKAGPDFAVQGEYVGTAEREGEEVKLGAQVVALGGGTFHAVGYWGGLPGDGGQLETRIEVDAQMRDGVAAFFGFPAKGQTSKIRDGMLSVWSPKGRKAGELKRVIRKSPTVGMKPPAGAIVLFDGSTADHFKNGHMTEDGLLMQGATSRRRFHSVKLHLEFRIPFVPYARGQRRGNSGCFLQRRYEVQILDSLGLAGKHNECGGIYAIRDCDVNMCFPPLSWQTFDIEFRAAKFDANGKRVAPATMTVRHNGVLIHHKCVLPPAFPGRPNKERKAGPLRLQDHRNPVHFRNIWLVEKD